MSDDDYLHVLVITSSCSAKAAKKTICKVSLSLGI
jgi:hypothetical protein